MRPGKYVEDVVLDGTLRRKDFDGLTIEGTVKNRRKVIVEGRNAKGDLGPAANGIDAINVNEVVLKNMWARNFQANGFFVRSIDGRSCNGYTMTNLLASDNRGYGLFARGCRGGKMTNSTAFRHGDSGFYIGETLCDSGSWTNHGIVPPPAPCQRKPKWTLLRDLKSYENVLGYSGTNAKYVRILDSAFYNNGAGIVPNTLDSERFEPTGWTVIENNDVFWNNYNYFLSGTSVRTVSDGLAQVGNATVNFPTGIGIALFGSANTVVSQNNIFGNYKWGVASFSAPGEFIVANVGDDAKNINNQFLENTMGRDGADPNGEFDFWNDATGGGNCWAGNSGNSTFAPGNGKVPAVDHLSHLPAGGSARRPGAQPRHHRRPADKPGPGKRPENDLRLRQLDPAPEPAVQLGPARRHASALPEIHPGRGGGAARRTHLPMSRVAPLRSLRLPALLLGALVLSGASAAVAQAPPKPTRVTVNDYFFSPSAVTIRKGGSVKWVWSSANAYPHDVHLKSGPKGTAGKTLLLDHDLGGRQARFQKAFETAGTYRYFCTIHPREMRMTVVVGKPVGAGPSQRPRRLPRFGFADLVARRAFRAGFAASWRVRSPAFSVASAIVIWNIASSASEASGRTRSRVSRTFGHSSSGWPARSNGSQISLAKRSM